ncbi:hypothetical protein GCM10007416_18210 [Kroppenstedtia guangzhouensis]|uniref:Uncharacterized protein n=1 Tax=Kroppenstedtia guangzhouensis TaxID=1274356 RepID=A0ABQ1GK68_9BACL|nr:hypothetical protein GCM10007416_18210 [Kroppenstedtia guangzhouensis]
MLMEIGKTWVKKAKTVQLSKGRADTGISEQGVKTVLSSDHFGISLTLDKMK